MKNTQILLQAEEISTLAKIEATANDFVSDVKNGEIAKVDRCMQGADTRRGVARR